MAQLKSFAGVNFLMGNDRQGEVHAKGLRAGMGTGMPEPPRTLRRSVPVLRQPNCLSWLCFAPVSNVAENVPGKNSGRFWENFLHGKRLPWADRQV